MVATDEFYDVVENENIINGEEAASDEVPQSDSINLKQEAAKALSDGVRDLFESEIPTAVSSLEQACKLFAKAYGKNSHVCAETYFYYGMALLQMAKLEKSSFGRLEDVPEKDEQIEISVNDNTKLNEEEEHKFKKHSNASNDNLEKNVITAQILEVDDCYIHTEVHVGKGSLKKLNDEADIEMARKDSSINVSHERGKTMKMEDSQKNKQTINAKNKNGAFIAVKHNFKSEDFKTEVEEIKKDEDKSLHKVNNKDRDSILELAWEMLELAKNGFTESFEISQDPTVERMLCETFMVRGEVGVENKNYLQGVQDFSVCLQRRKSMLPSDSRCIAETLYQLAVAQHLCKQWDEAIINFEAAINVLEKRIENVKENNERDETLNKLESLIPNLMEGENSIDRMQTIHYLKRRLEHLKSFHKQTDDYHAREKDPTQLEQWIADIKLKIAETKRKKTVNFHNILEASGSSIESSKSSIDISKTNANKGIKRKAEESPMN